MLKSQIKGTKTVKERKDIVLINVFNFTVRTLQGLIIISHEVTDYCTFNYFGLKVCLFTLLRSTSLISLKFVKMYYLPYFVNSSHLLFLPQKPDVHSLIFNK